MALFDFSGGKKDKQKELADKLAKIKDLQRPPNQVRAQTGYTVGSRDDVVNSILTYQKTGKEQDPRTRADMVNSRPIPAAAKAALAKKKKK